MRFFGVRRGGRKKKSYDLNMRTTMNIYTKPPAAHERFMIYPPKGVKATEEGRPLGSWEGRRGEWVDEKNRAEK